MLQRGVADNARRLDAIDQGGTRGVGIVQQQLMDVKGDLAGLTVRMDRHEQEHKDESRERIDSRIKEQQRKDEERTATRRFRIMATIAAAAAIAGLYALLIDFAAHLH
jgi:hypothetical protein